jgi:hypothetical protein
MDGAGGSTEEGRVPGQKEQLVSHQNVEHGSVGSWKLEVCLSLARVLPCYCALGVHCHGYQLLIS